MPELTYQEQLRSPEWISFRTGILVRDNNTCTNCNNARLFENCKVAIASRNNNRLFGKECPSQGIFISPSTPEANFYLTYFYIDEENNPILIGLKGISCKEAFYRRAIRESKASQSSSKPFTPIEWLQSNKHDLMMWEFSLRCKGLEPEEFESFVLDETSSGWLIMRGLHVHHRYYVEGKKAWEYPHDALTTLCWNCHFDLHRNGTVIVYDKIGNNLGHYLVCKRCNGAGWFPQYVHNKDGICFRCYGAKYEELIG